MRTSVKLFFAILTVVVVVPLFYQEDGVNKLSYDDKINREINALTNASDRSSNSDINEIEPQHHSDPWAYEAVKKQMIAVSNAYEENIRYPKYSKPLATNDWALLNPRPFIPKKLPMDFDEKVSASIVLDHYIVHLDQNLPVSVRVNGNARVNKVQVYLEGDKDKKYAVTLSPGGMADGAQTFLAEIPFEVLSATGRGEMLIFADINFANEQQAKVSAVFKLVETDAILTALNEAYIEGPHLMIPAEFDIAISGYYRFEANLFDKGSKQPISHLNSTFLLTKEDNTGLIKVHAMTLRRTGFAGPYILTDINITRGPAKPSDKSGYGVAKEESYQIRGFDLSYYSNEAFVDPKNQQRLDFLQKMAGVNL